MMRRPTQKQPEQIIRDKLSAVQRRMRIEGIFQKLATFNFWALLITGILLAVNRFFPLSIPIGVAALLPVVVASVIAVGLNVIQKIDPFAVAHLVDRRLNLKERLSTALEAIQQNRTDDFATLQVRDAAQAVHGLIPAAAFSYTVPAALKWLLIPIALVGLSFFVPRMYEVPPPPTPAEQAALHDAAAKLEQAVNGFDDSELSKAVEDAVKTLRNRRTGVQAAQTELSKLRESVQARKDQLAENDVDQAVKAISALSESSELLSGADAEQVASDLQKLADQMDELTDAQRAELDALLKQLADRLRGNSSAKGIVDQLNEIETKAVNPELLAKIARSMLAIDQQTKDRAQLETILEEIKASRKDIGLAGIEMERKTGGVASSDGGPGEESGTGEAQGTQVGAMRSEAQPAEALLLSGASADLDAFSTASASVQEKPTGENEPTYTPYREVYLNAQRAYAEAIDRDRIPVRYQQRVKDYIDAIANTGE